MTDISPEALQSAISDILAIPKGGSYAYAEVDKLFAIARAQAARIKELEAAANMALSIFDNEGWGKYTYMDGVDLYTEASLASKALKKALPAPPNPIFDDIEGRN